MVPETLQMLNQSEQLHAALEKVTNTFLHTPPPRSNLRYKVVLISIVAVVLEIDALQVYPRNELAAWSGFEDKV
jgi:hypothetical protein